jgi:hypothetical protein
MNWIVDWWKLLALVLFIGMIVGLKYFAQWGVGNWGWWFTIAAVGFFVLVAWIIDRRSGPEQDSE